VTVPGGLIEEVFQRALDALLPAGPPARRAVLAGPGRPAHDADADILLVPDHPQTGETWTPANPAASAYSVPLPFGVWLWLVFPEPYLTVPASGGMPDGVLRDDLPAPRPRHRFRADSGAFQHTLVRLPAVRSPWLREILENLTQHMRAGHFWPAGRRRRHPISSGPVTVSRPSCRSSARIDRIIAREGALGRSVPQRTEAVVGHAGLG
jgi:hypothetical protein